MNDHVTQESDLPPPQLTLVRTLCAAEGPGIWGQLFPADSLAEGLMRLAKEGHQVIAQDDVHFDRVDADDMAIYHGAKGLKVATWFEFGYAMGLLKWSQPVR